MFNAILSMRSFFQKVKWHLTQDVDIFLVFYVTSS